MSVFDDIAASEAAARQTALEAYYGLLVDISGTTATTEQRDELAQLMADAGKNAGDGRKDAELVAAALYQSSLAEQLAARRTAYDTAQADDATKEAAYQTAMTNLRLSRVARDSASRQLDQSTDGTQYLAKLAINNPALHAAVTA